jgi:hypothetical protein
MLIGPSIQERAGKMKLTKQRLKEMIMKELGMYQYAPDMPISGDLIGALEEVVEQWAPETDEGQKYEADILALIGQLGAPRAEAEE